MKGSKLSTKQKGLCGSIFGSAIIDIMRENGAERCRITANTRDLPARTATFGPRDSSWRKAIQVWSDQVTTRWM